MNLEDLINNYINAGMVRDKAVARVCGETLLYRIAKSSIRSNVTVKGGIVIMNISGDERRTTRDLDLDFIRYALTEKSILDFIKKLNAVDNNIKLKVTYPIKELNHDNYKGKRVNLNVSDKFKHNYNYVLDIGVHKFADLEQEEYYFNINSYNEKVSLLINSKEQIFYEKLESLLNKGASTSRFKDLFDFYYFIKINSVDKEKFRKIVKKYLLESETVEEKSFDDIYERLCTIFAFKNFVEKITTDRYNWVEISGEEIVKTILEFFEKLRETIAV